MADDLSAELTPPERMFIDSWTDEEWQAVIRAFPPDTDVRDAIGFINERRADAHEGTDR